MLRSTMVRLIVGVFLISISLIATPAVAAAGDMVDGIVEDVDGAPIAGATVCIVELSLCTMTPTMPAYGDGYFHIDTPNVGNTTLTLAVSAPGFLDKTQTIEFEEFAGGVSYSRDNLVVLERAGQTNANEGMTVSGHVRDQHGNPVPNAFVTVQVSEVSVVQQVYANDAGFYTFQNISDGTYSIRSTRNVDGGPWRYFASDPTPFTVSSEDVVVDLVMVREATISISGTVVDSSGNPVARASVEYDWTLRASRASTTNSDGTFTIVGIPANSQFAQQLRVQGETCTWEQYQYFSVSDEINASGGNVGTLVYTACGDIGIPGNGGETEPFHQVIGQVVDLNGSAVAGAAVCTPMSGWGDTLCVTTDVEGRFNVGEGTTANFLLGYSQVPVTVTFQNCSAHKTVPHEDGVIEVGTLRLDCVIGEPGNANGGDTPGDGEAEENSFTLTNAQRMCEDQSFLATWTGTNIESLEFALNNTSDDWTSGWLEADPAVGVFTAEVDHHNYDKVGVQVTFTDGTTEQFSADTSSCAAAEAPAPVNPPVNSGSGTSGGSSGGGQSTAAVSSLPSTGIGTSNAGLLVLASAAVMMLAGAAAITRSGITRR